MASVSITTSSGLQPALDHHTDGTEEDRSRLRVSKACSRCRTRKDRCDGLRPACTSCQSANASCTYEATTKKRGLPEGYVRGLEKLTTIACLTIEGLEDVLLDYLKNDEVQKAWNTTSGDELYTQWKEESGVRQQLEEFLQVTTTGTKRKRSAEDSSSDSPQDLEHILDLVRAKRFRVTEGTGSPFEASNNLPASTRNGLGRLGSHRLEGSQSTSAKLPTNSKELLDLYFKHVHCWFPVVDRPAVLKTYYSALRTTPRAMTKELDGGMALLWAIFAYAVALDHEAATGQKQTLNHEYSEIALKYIPTPYTNAEDTCDFDVLQAQALAVLALLRLGNGQWLGAWMCTGRATRILLAKDHETTKRQAGTLQGCFILETLLNVHFENSEPLFTSSLVHNLINEDGHEEWEPWQNSQEPSFALSIFNRLTRIFLILHEAVTEPQSSRDPAYVRAKLTAIHAVAQEHFASGIGSPTMDSPPHHVYFQIGLLFAQLRLVSRVSDEHVIDFDLASLAKNVLGLFEICAKSNYIGLTRVPPLFADILNLAIAVAATSSATFETSAASPSYYDFVSSISNFRGQLTSLWSSFRGENLELSTPVGLQGSEKAQDITTDPQVASRDFQVEGTGDLNSISVPDITTSPPNFARPNPLQSDWMRNPSVVSTTSPLETFPNRGSFSHSNWPVFPPMHTSQPMTGYPGTSPSFAGDEVDAIFHEMAHLDTNEWTNERALGLKDFGFSDETAFMDFCNDPERLAMPLEGGAMPLSSNRQSWAFTAQPP